MKKKKSTARDKFGKDQRLSQAAWDERYKSREMSWDIGRSTPPLVRMSQYINALGKRVLVPGCGRGYEAQMFANLGADVVAVDFSARALAEASKLAVKSLGPKAYRIEWVQSDVRSLPRQYSQCFDLVVEHTCFCALAPADRHRYIAELHHVLKPVGRLLGLFFVDFDNPDGPPFGIYQHKLRPLLEEFFHVLFWESYPADSWDERKNQEALVIAQKVATKCFSTP